MIVLDTSAIVAMALQEERAAEVARRVDEEDTFLISAGTLVELLVVSTLRGFDPIVRNILDELSPETVPVDAAEAERVRLAYRRFGKGLHPAGLNMGDCYAYALAVSRDLPLLFVGDDFARTDVRPALVA